MRKIHPILTGMLDFVFPPLCAGCGHYDDSSTGICVRCRRMIDVFNRPTCLSCGTVLSSDVKCPVCADDSLPLFAYGNYHQTPLRDIIIQFKFRDVLPPVETLVSALAKAFAPQLKELSADCLVPIPLHPYREHKRGYNQARIIAESLAPLIELTVDEHLIQRTKRRRPQSKLAVAKREKNIQGVFSVPEIPTTKLRIILVDDVVTSGATVTEAKKILVAAGHTVVGVVALAHGV
ncbi:MAG: ComF family protein [candidate division Zixibacteria bacterium]|nr:ComF family protein [candidate division Zixibacteria bacterium]